MEHTAEHWDEQAELALDYAHHRPPSDMRGFFDALRDRVQFKQQAASLRLAS